MHEAGFTQGLSGVVKAWSILKVHAWEWFPRQWEPPQSGSSLPHHITATRLAHLDLMH